MKQGRAVSGYQIARQSIALTLSLLIIPFASGNLFGQPGGYAPLDPVGLDQLVAPIALYPDSLVAQILTASTYPQQVNDADNWSQQTAGMPPQQRADVANGMPWDPSVKALTAFPSVLDNMARNQNWTSSLGNAYYNQPGDVMNAVQAARVQAQQAGYLRSTPQQQVYDNGGLITIVPVNAGVVYVPYYDPWRVYGGWVSPYAGFYVAPPPRGLVLGIGLGFAAVGISIGLFSHYGWGYHNWAPNWRGGVVEYNHAAYISRSPTVFNHGHFGAYNRGVFEHGGPGVPNNFHPAVTRGAAGFAPARNDRPGPGSFNHAAPGIARPSVAGRPESRPPVAARPESRPPVAARPESRPPAAARPEARPQFDRSQAPRSAPAQSHAAPHAAPESHAAAPSHAAPQGHAAQPHGRPEEHEHH